MGPFVPDIISDELNLVIGFFIGMGFGFVLEQAGFSSSRKLTGLFYGRDFTVLRVFFTAAVTAMSGVILLGYAGLLDVSIIYINPTYLFAAIIGGVIMGVGFVVGGYCPGTSVCAMSIGKIDALFFVLGGLLGVVVFGEFYPVIEPLYDGSFFGDITAFSVLGVSPGAFALGLILVAVAAFIVTTRIEKKVNPDAVSRQFPFVRHILAGTGVVALGVVLLVLPDRKTHLLSEVSDPDYLQSHPVKSISADELAFRILDRDPSLLLIDLREGTDSTRVRLPGAMPIPVADIIGKGWRDLLIQKRKKKIFLADDEMSEREAGALALRLGYENVEILAGGMKEFAGTIMHAGPLPENPTMAERDEYRFRTRAAERITTMVKEEGAPRQVVKLVKKVAGGCGA